MQYMEDEFPILWIIGLVMVAVYPILAIEFLISGSSAFPYLAAALEEIVKAIIIIYFIIKKKPSMKNAILYGVAAGVAFGFLENLIYAVRFVPRPDFGVIILSRFLQPFVIHIVASLCFTR